MMLSNISKSPGAVRPTITDRQTGNILLNKLIASQILFSHITNSFRAVLTNMEEKKLISSWPQNYGQNFVKYIF